MGQYKENFANEDLTTFEAVSQMTMEYVLLSSIKITGFISIIFFTKLQDQML